MKHLVVLTGAGISAESGLKTFRDSDGLWEGYNIEEVATPRGWRKNPQQVLDFYNMRRKNVLEAQPNAAHIAIAKLEAYFKISIITQNIDDLHERAGSTNILHLHGEITKMRSESDETLIYPIREDIKWGDTAHDGAQLRPHIVWFEEPVPMITAAVDIARTADIFLLIGSSLQVYPAAGLLDMVPYSAIKYVIDKKIPPAVNSTRLNCLETSATQGMAELFPHLVLMA